MCGIVGIVGLRNNRRQIVSSMLSAIKHRGPDEDGYYSSTLADIAVCRLSIVDLESSKQPMTFVENNLVVSFNGEIYNFKELRKSLISSGIKIKTKGDTEIIGHLFTLYGEGFVSMITGMFTISIWDESRKMLLLYRDRTGQKPLFYKKHSDNCIDYSSEIKSLLIDNSLREVDYDSLNSMLVLGYIPSPYTAYKSIYSLEPAHYLKWHEGKVTIAKYWDPYSGTIPQPKDFNDALLITSNLIDNSTKLTLNSERNICVLLSGGIDSSIVTHFANKNNNGNPLSTISLSVGSTNYDETSYALLISEMMGTIHHVFSFDSSPEAMYSYLSNYADTPFADSSVILMHQLTKYMRENNFIVGLTGDGGDELFGGYSKYRNFVKYTQLKPFLKFSQGLLPKLRPDSLFQNNNRFRKYSQYDSKDSDNLLKFNSMFSPSLTQNIWHKEHRNDINFNSISELFSTIWFMSRGDSKIDKQLHLDQLTYLPGDINFKSDASASANGVELRSPLQDHLLIEFINNLPPDLKINYKENKIILKNLLSNLYPDYNLKRPKYGFGFDRANAIRYEYKELIHDHLLGQAAKRRGWFDLVMIEKLLTEHQKGKNYDNLIWPLFIVEVWAQNWLDKSNGR